MPNIPLRLRLIVGLLFVLVAYVSILWPDAILYLVLGIFAIAVLVDKLLRQQVEFEKPRKSRKQPKVDDGIPPDPTWDQIRESLARAGNNSHVRPSEPQQMTLFGNAVPARRTEQIVRKNNSQEPDWPSFDQMHPELFRK